MYRQIFILLFLFSGLSAKSQFYSQVDSSSVTVAMQFYQRAVDVMDSAKVSISENGYNHRSEYWHAQNRACSLLKTSVRCFEKVLEDQPENSMVVGFVGQLRGKIGEMEEVDY